MSRAEETASASVEDRAAFLLHLRENGVRDLRVLRAMEAVPRQAFVAERHAGLAFREIALPSARGGSVPEPLLVARLLAGSRLEAGHRVLLVGLGAGYTTAVLSRLVHRVVAMGRLPSLVAAARTRFAALGLDNIDVRCADGLSGTADTDVFDRIILMGEVPIVPPSLWLHVATDGAVIHARPEDGARPGRQVLVRVEKPVDGIGRQIVLAPSRLTSLRSGAVAMVEEEGRSPYGQPEAGLP